MSVCYGWVSLSLLLVSLDLYYKDYNKIKTSCYYYIAIYYITQQKLLYTIERLENIVSVILLYLIKSLSKTGHRRGGGTNHLAFVIYHNTLLIAVLLDLNKSCPLLICMLVLVTNQPCTYHQSKNV